MILHCVSGYPAPAADYNLNTIPDMRNRFDSLVGLSDHTLSNTTALASIALGACVIEKHVTLDRTGGGPDDSFSLEPHELEALCSESLITWKALGEVNYSRKESEKNNAVFRRSLYAVKDISAGEILTEENIRSIRPGYGLPPKMYEEVLGKKAKININAGTALKVDYLD